MTAAPQSTGPGVAPTADSLQHHARPSQLSQALIWVGIVAGILFVVAVIFFSGYFLGWNSREPDGPDRAGWTGQIGPGSQMGPGRMMGPGGPTGPGGMMGPGGMPSMSPPTAPRP